MARVPVLPITRVYLLTDNQQVLVVTVDGQHSAEDQIEALPLLRQFLEGCEAAGWSSTCVSSSIEPSPEDEGYSRERARQVLRAWRGRWSRRVLH